MIDSLFIIAPIVVGEWALFCYSVLYVLLVLQSSWCGRESWLLYLFAYLMYCDN